MIRWISQLRSLHDGHASTGKPLRAPDQAHKQADLGILVFKLNTEVDLSIV